MGTEVDGTEREFKDGIKVGYHRKRIPSSETESQRRRTGWGTQRVRCQQGRWSGGSSLPELSPLRCNCLGSAEKTGVAEAPRSVSGTDGEAGWAERS